MPCSRCIQHVHLEEVDHADSTNVQRVSAGERVVQGCLINRRQRRRRPIH